jgi:hypothetical protein
MEFDPAHLDEKLPPPGNEVVYEFAFWIPPLHPMKGAGYELKDG